MAHLTLLTTTENHGHREKLSRVAIRGFLKPSACVAIWVTGILILGQVIGGSLAWAVKLLLGLLVSGCLGYWHTQKRISRWMRQVRAEAEAVGLEPLVHGKR